MFSTIDLSERVGSGFENLTGETFGRLTVLGLSGRRGGRKSYWVCKCICGNKKVVRGDVLKVGDVKSCGCLKKEADKTNLTKNHRHKESKTHLYTTWQGMKARCYNKNLRSYEDYGGRGITMCSAWSDRYETFRDWANINGYETHLSIERIDVNKGYKPENCTWIKVNEQANNRRSTVWLEWDGETNNIKQWSKKLGFKYGTLYSRYKRGKRPPELFEPLQLK